MKTRKLVAPKKYLEGYAFLDRSVAGWAGWMVDTSVFVCKLAAEGKVMDGYACI